MAAVQCYVDKAQNCWDEHPAHIAGALRSDVNRNSGFTVNKLTLGQMLNTAADLLSPGPRRGGPLDVEAQVYSRTYEEGDLVYILDMATVKGKCRKMSPSLKGTGIVIKKLSSYLHRVKTKGTVIVANHYRFKKCVDRDIPLWLSRYRV